MNIRRGSLYSLTKNFPYFEGGADIVGRDMGSKGASRTERKGVLLATCVSTTEDKWISQQTSVCRNAKPGDSHPYRTHTLVLCKPPEVTLNSIGRKHKSD